MPSSFAVRPPTPYKINLTLAQTGAGVPQEGPERSKTAQGHPGAPQESPRDGQNASRIALWALDALWDDSGSQMGTKMKLKLTKKQLSKVVSDRVSHAHFGFHALAFSKNILQIFLNSSVKQKQYPWVDSLKNAIFYKCCTINVHVSTTPEKHLQKSLRIGPKSLKIDIRTHPERSCEAKRAEEERKCA